MNKHASVIIIVYHVVHVYLHDHHYQTGLEPLRLFLDLYFKVPCLMVVNPFLPFFSLFNRNAFAL